MTLHRDCLSCYSMYLHVDTDPCGNCLEHSEWKPAEKPELIRRYIHITEIINEL